MNMVKLDPIDMRPFDKEDWQHAENLYRSGEPDKLATMLRSRKAIPRQQRVFLAELAEGKVKLPSKRGRKNAKLTYEQRAEIHDALRSLRWSHASTKRHAEWLSDELGIGVREIITPLAAQRAGYIAYLARKYGVSENSIPKIAQRFKEISPYSPALLAKIRKRR